MAPSLCQKCVSGSIHEGTAAGKTIDVDGTKVYIAQPEGDYNKEVALLFLTDIFGIDLSNNQLLADSYAKQGLMVYMPDYLNGDPVPVKEMESGKFNLMEWFPTHGSEQTRPGLDKTIEYAKKQGVKRFAAVGYCFGARYVFDLAYENKLAVGAVSHPSLIQPEDLEKMAKLDFPLLINSCGTDQMFPKEKIELADKLMGSQTQRYKREHFEDQSHGFAVRGDFSKPENKQAHDQAFRNSYQWIASKL